MKIIKTIAIVTVMILAVACNKEKSLQEYYVENQEDNKFIAVDIPTSLFANTENMDAEQKETLESVRKINVLAYPLKEKSDSFESEKAELEKILGNEEYQLLMKYGSNDRKAALYFTGKEDAIDEIVAFGYDSERGMGVARILGKNMNPEKIWKMLRSFDGDEINKEGLQGIFGMIGNQSGVSVKRDSTATESGFNIDVKVDTVSTSN